MDREHLIMHLEAYGCEIIVPSSQKKRFVIAKNNANGQQHAIRDDKIIKSTHVCYICRRLGVEVPQSVQVHLKLIDEVGKTHGVDFESDPM